jgi:hypothetical protein
MTLTVLRGTARAVARLWRRQTSEPYAARRRGGPGAPTIFHPPGTIRIVTPVEEPSAPASPAVAASEPHGGARP